MGSQAEAILFYGILYSHQEWNELEINGDDLFETGNFGIYGYANSGDYESGYLFVPGYIHSTDAIDGLSFDKLPVIDHDTKMAIKEKMFNICTKFKLPLKETQWHLVAYYG